MTTTPKRRLRSATASLLRRSRRLLERTAPGAEGAAVQFDPGAPALVLSPHWDDAVLSCWSVLATTGEVNVVNIFAALPEPGRRGPWEAFAGLRDSRERAQARIQEDARALSLAGRSAHNLQLPEIQQRRAPEAVGPSAVGRALADAVPAASRVYAPAGIGGHVDHVLARRSAQALLRAGIPVTLYAELPYCVIHGWPKWVGADGPVGPGDVDAYWLAFLTDVPEMPPLREGRVVRLDVRTAALKLEAIACYQLSLGLTARETLAAGSFHTTEVMWDLRRGDHPAG
jgi:LmbE family N-acetylglucosaminyl deacetylase